MVADDMSVESSDVVVPENGKLTIDGSEINGGIISDGQKITWSPDSTLTAKTTITYPVELKDIQSLMIGENEVKLNGSAKLSYNLTSNGRNYELPFNCPTDVVAVGQLVENYYLDGDLQEDLTVTHPKVLVYGDNARNNPAIKR